MFKDINIANDLTHILKILFRNRSLEQYQSGQKIDSHCFTYQVNDDVSWNQSRKEWSHEELQETDEIESETTYIRNHQISHKYKWNVGGKQLVLFFREWKKGSQYTTDWVQTLLSSQN